MTEWQKISTIEVFRNSEHEVFQSRELELPIDTSPDDESTVIASPQENTPKQESTPELSLLDHGMLTDISTDNLMPIDLATNPFIRTPSSMAKAAAARAAAKKSRFRFSFRLPRIPIVPIVLSVALGSLVYFAYPHLDEWFSTFPEIPDLSRDQYSALKSVANSDIKAIGPKIEIASSLKSDGSSTFYVATNLADDTAFDLVFKPISETLVGEPRQVAPAHISTKKHLAVAAIASVPPGYYWMDVTSPLQSSLSIHQKIFLGGSPDLTYQTRLRDYMAVRRGIAKAELDRIRDALVKAQALMKAENAAAESLSTLAINQAKAQAWDIFQSTWTRGLDEIQALLGKPSRFSGNLLREAQGVQEPLKKLHDKHHELIAAVVTPASAPLSRGTVTSARVFADAQVISKDLDALITKLHVTADEREKLFNNTSETIVEEP